MNKLDINASYFHKARLKVLSQGVICNAMNVVELRIFMETKTVEDIYR